MNFITGDQDIKITGTNLPINPINVQIGNATLTVKSSNSTELIIASVALEPGLYDLIIPTPDLGIAV